MPAIPPVPRPWRCGFSLVEMLVVIGIIGILFGLGIPGLAAAQKRMDANNTINALTSLHQNCLRQARQMASADVIYGFTLRYVADAAYGGSAATVIKPWVRDGAHPYRYNHEWEAKAILGGSVLWKTAAAVADGPVVISLVDNQRPGKPVTMGASVDGSSFSVQTPSSSAFDIHVAYEPGTGFVHVVEGASDSLPTYTSASDLTPGTRRKLQFQIWSKTPSPARARYQITIHPTGIIDVTGA